MQDAKISMQLFSYQQIIYHYSLQSEFKNIFNFFIIIIILKQRIVNYYYY